MKKILFICLALPLLYSCHNHDKDKEDPTKSSPNNYVTVLENDRIRVLKEVLRPGESTEWHESPATVAYYLTDNTEIREHFPKDKTYDKKIRKGTIKYKEGITKHKFQNIGRNKSEAIIIELK